MMPGLASGSDLERHLATAKGCDGVGVGLPSTTEAASLIETIRTADTGAGVVAMLRIKSPPPIVLTSAKL